MSDEAQNILSNICYNLAKARNEWNKLSYEEQQEINEIGRYTYPLEFFLKHSEISANEAMAHIQSHNKKTNR